MPRSRRRRKNDRRREAEQRLAARMVLQRQREAEKAKLERYVKAVLRPKAGEEIATHDGRKYLVETDGSLRRIEGGML